MASIYNASKEILIKIMRRPQNLYSHYLILITLWPMLCKAQDDDPCRTSGRCRQFGFSITILLNIYSQHHLIHVTCMYVWGQVRGIRGVQLTRHPGVQLSARILPVGQLEQRVREKGPFGLPREGWGWFLEASDIDPVDPLGPVVRGGSRVRASVPGQLLLPSLWLLRWCWM